MDVIDKKVKSQRFLCIPAPEVMKMFRDRKFMREKWIDNDLGSR